MPVTAITSPAADLTVGAVWRMGVAVTDFVGAVSDAMPTVTVALPDGTTQSGTVVRVVAGAFVVDYLPVVAGRYVAHWSTAFGAVDFAAFVAAVVTAAGMPDRDEYKDYAGIDPGDTSRDTEIDGALEAEASAQRAVCLVPAAYPPDLREALLRRVSRNLALRLLPLAVLRGDADAGTDNLVLPGRDPEVRRLEGPHRRLRMG